MTRTLVAMNLSHIASAAFVTFIGVAACGESKDSMVNAERTAACADRTNGVSCNACCETKSANFADAKCTCKGEVVKK